MLLNYCTIRRIYDQNRPHCVVGWAYLLTNRGASMKIPIKLSDLINTEKDPAIDAYLDSLLSIERVNEYKKIEPHNGAFFMSKFNEEK